MHVFSKIFLKCLKNYFVSETVRITGRDAAGRFVIVAPDSDSDTSDTESPQGTRKRPLEKTPEQVEKRARHWEQIHSPAQDTDSSSEEDYSDDEFFNQPTPIRNLAIDLTTPEKQELHDSFWSRSTPIPTTPQFEGICQVTPSIIEEGTHEGFWNQKTPMHEAFSLTESFFGEQTDDEDSEIHLSEETSQPILPSVFRRLEF